MGGKHLSEKLFGLVGRNIEYSFSRRYFSEKFKALHLEHCSYVNFDIPEISNFQDIIAKNPTLCGLNVTIPYKEVVIPFLSELSAEARQIGAVNTIEIKPEGLKGHNTDCFGFEQSIRPYLKDHHKKALILGSGGASKAVAFVFRKLGIEHLLVSRNPTKSEISYSDIGETLLNDYLIIVNATPIGTFPKVSLKPDLPYQYLSPKHLLYDLVYNPLETAFMSNGRQRQATAINGLKMLELQAEKAWEIWSDSF